MSPGVDRVVVESVELEVEPPEDGVVGCGESEAVGGCGDIVVRE